MVKYNPTGGLPTDVDVRGDLTVDGASTLGNGGDTTNVKSTLQVDGTTIQTGNLVMGSVLDHNGTQIGFFNEATAAQQALIADPSGGTTTDAEARAAIVSILDLLAAYGLMASA